VTLVVTGGRLRDGGPADLLVHDAAREVDLLARHEPPRAVIRAGRVVAGAGPA
jgi:cytosine deaminase